MTADLADPGYRALSCACGRVPVLQSGRCWSCEPKPTPAVVEDIRRRPRLADRIVGRLASHPGSTSHDLADGLGAHLDTVRAEIVLLRRAGRIRFGGTVAGVDRTPRKRWFLKEAP